MQRKSDRPGDTITGTHEYRKHIEKYSVMSPKTFIEFKVPNSQVLKNNNMTAGDVPAMYTNKTLMHLKDQVNNAKNLIDKYSLDVAHHALWERTLLNLRITNELVKFVKARDKINGQHVTRAWLKFYELHTKYNTVPERPGNIKIFFNAEFPGASICAFNHYMKTIRPAVKWDWIASSYMPALLKNNNSNSNTTALEDTYGLYHGNLANWMMTKTNDGDMTNINNILDYEKRIGRTIDIYTHDAGIDVSDDYNLQEEANARLHLGCALMGFLVLRPGGSFIAKQYTYFETLTMNLIAIYATLFDAFYICKPMTSGYSNSEIYLVGKGFRGLNDTVRQLLTVRFEKFSMLPIIDSDDMKKEFLDVILASAKLFAQMQIDTIRLNVDLYEATIGPLENHSTSKLPAVTKLLSDLQPAQRAYSIAWTKMYPIKPINVSDYLPEAPH